MPALERQSLQLLAPYEARFSNRNADISLSNAVVWSSKYNIRYVTLGNYVFLIYDNALRQVSEPIGQVGPAAVNVLRLLFDHLGQSTLHIRHASVDFFNALHDAQLAFTATELRDHYDYCYLTKSLATLTGNRFHKKKNHVNQFNKHYGSRASFVPIDVQNAEDCLSVADQWCDSHNCGISQDLCTEYNGIKDIATHWAEFPLFGFLLYVDDAPIGFVIAEAIHQDYCLIHFEKALRHIKGAYAYINYATANALEKRFLYINREQDLGIAGLKKAKMSYHPDHFIKKYDIVISRY